MYCVAQDLYLELCGEGSALPSVHAARLQALTAATAKSWPDIKEVADKVTVSSTPLYRVRYLE